LATLVWFSIGGIRDIKDFFLALRTMSRDSHDDGRVDESRIVETRGFEPVVPSSMSPMQGPTTAAATTTPTAVV
jgi:hypothetical protein